MPQVSWADLEWDRAALAPPRTAPPTGFVLSLLVGTLLHACAFGALLWRGTPPLGHGGTDMEAIGFDVVDWSAVESLRSATVRVGGAPAVLELTEGLPMPALPTSAPAVDAAQALPRTAPLNLPPAPGAGPLATLEFPAEPPKITLVSRELTRPSSDHATPSPPALAAISAPTGGTSSFAAVETTPAPAAAPVSAAPGVRRAYDLAVGEALRAARPKSDGRLKDRGRVWVEFTVGPQGALETIRVKETSGSAVLDERALASVRRARFPVADPRLSAAERTFALPYTFR